VASNEGLDVDGKLSKKPQRNAKEISVVDAQCLPSCASFYSGAKLRRKLVFLIIDRQACQ
jgi:hypothetical protein